jgi:hypothetical protein
MQFQEVTKFVPGTKYQIVYSIYLKFTGLYSHTEGQYPVHTFKEVNGYGEKKFIQSINKFYEPIFQRDRIQQTMEERALQLILKNIIGDSTFRW